MQKKNIYIFNHSLGFPFMFDLIEKKTVPQVPDNCTHCHNIR